MPLTSSSDVAGPGAVVAPGADPLASPKSTADVLAKHRELKAGAVENAVKRGRGRPRKDGTAGPGPAPRGPADGPMLPADLFTPDSVRPFVELPFALSGVFLRTDAFALDPRESDTLASQGALVANLYAPGWDPKSVALVAFALGFATIAAKKTMAYMAELKEKREEKIKKEMSAKSAAA